MFFSVYSTTDKHFFSDYQISSPAYETIKAARKKTNRDLISRLYINDQPLFFDKPNNRYFFSLSEDACVNDLSIGFTTEMSDIRIGILGDYSPDRDIPIIAYTQSAYKEYTLVTTSLPIIQINTEKVISYITTPIEFILLNTWPYSGQPLIKSDGTIHTRGGSAMFYPKQYFRVKLTTKTVSNEIVENDLALLGLRQDGDWLLYPAYDDPEKIRNVFSSNLWFNSCAKDTNFNMVNGNEFRYVELFINQQYWGLYALSYPIDIKQMNIRHGNTFFYDEFLYKQKGWGPVSDDLSIDDTIVPQFDASEQVRSYGNSLLQMYFQYLRSDLSDGLIHNDENNVLDMWLYIKLIQGTDMVLRNMQKNMYYSIKLSENGKKIIYTPWDMDTTWGSKWKSDYFNLTKPYVLNSDDNSIEMRLNPVSILLELDESIVKKIQNRYMSLRSEGWSDEKIDEMLDEFERDIFDSGAYKRDMDRWPEGSYEDPDLKLSVFRVYVHERLKSMDSYIANLGK